MINRQILAALLVVAGNLPTALFVNAAELQRLRGELSTAKGFEDSADAELKGAFFWGRQLEGSGLDNALDAELEEAAFWARQLEGSMSMSIPDPDDNFYDPQPTFSSHNGKLEVSLHMGPVGQNFGSPNFVSEIGGFEANIIGYSGCLSDGERCDDIDIKMGGPTLRVKPGDDLIIHLFNDMPEEKCKTTNNIGFWDDFHQPMNTNLHVHGLFVPNSENNVLDSIYPGESKTFNIKIRDVQQGGTHWYHPHAEGSVGLQAGGGAIGFIIVEDLEDDIPAEIASLPEILMRIQYTDWYYQHNSYVADYVTKCIAVCSDEESGYTCGCEDPETECSEPVFGIPAYKGEYGQAMTVNGAENPTFELHAGQWYHLRTVYVPTYKTPMEPALSDLENCDFKLLSKDGRYMPVTPRDIKSGYMFSGSRADFLVRCKKPGRYEFVSIDEVPRPYNWATWDGESNSVEPPSGAAYGQKWDAWTGTLATFKVVESPGQSLSELDEIRPFRPARPCYAPEMRDLKVDDSYFFLQSSLSPPSGEGEGETYPVFRKQPSAVAWNGANPADGNFYSVNNFIESDTGFPGRLKPPKESPVCDGKVTNEYGECYGTPPTQDFSFKIGDIVEIDYYAPQIHPLHVHVFGYQITQLPEFSVKNDYFQVGDYHDNLIVPISGDDDETSAEKPDYSKVVFRQHIYKLKTDIVVHCHFYRHSDRGMVALGKTKGTKGKYSSQVEGTCYHGLSGRKYQYE